MKASAIKYHHEKLDNHNNQSFVFAQIQQEHVKVNIRKLKAKSVEKEWDLTISYATCTAETAYLC